MPDIGNLNSHLAPDTTDQTTRCGSHTGNNIYISRGVTTEIVPTDEGVATENLRPSLEDYREGQEVWFYHPKLEKKWLKGVVESVASGFLRVSSSLFGFGRMISYSEEIAPGDWVLEG